jgi:hypothetical protein
MAVAGIAVTLKHGPGTGGFGLLHPLSGTSTVFALGENSDHAGENTVELVIDDDTNVVHDIVRWVGPTGQTGERWMLGFVDDNDIEHLREAVRWFSGQPSSTGSYGHPLAGASGSGETTANTNSTIVSLTGGKLRAELLTVRMLGNNDADLARCEVRVMIQSNPATTAFDGETITAGAEESYCTDSTGATGIAIGASSSNSSRGGFGDDEVAAAGTGYAMPFSSCVCTNDACRMYVMVVNVVESYVEHDDGDPTHCESLQDMRVALKVSEDYP